MYIHVYRANPTLLVAGHLHGPLLYRPAQVPEQSGFTYSSEFVTAATMNSTFTLRLAFTRYSFTSRLLCTNQVSLYCILWHNI